MNILMFPAAVFTLVTLLLALLWRLGLALLRRPAPRFWRRLLVWHVGLFVVHLFATVPLLFGYAAPGFVGTRPDERAYAGPRIAADDTWLIQSRQSLAAERDGKVEVEASVAKAADSHAVELTASDGVKLRAFLVPPAGAAAPEPRFTALLVHGLFRGALEGRPV